MDYTVKKLICKYFCYRLSYEEGKELCKWVKESDNNRRHFTRFKRRYRLRLLTRKLDVLMLN